MTYSVYQHWDPLKLCVVGRSYPPEFYDWITIPHVRQLFEKIAIETEEDLQKIVSTLQSFGVEVLRPELPETTEIQGKKVPPPLFPRDGMIMIGSTLYDNWSPDIVGFYNRVKDPNWPEIKNWIDFYELPSYIVDECYRIHGLTKLVNCDQNFQYQYKNIIDRVVKNNNSVKHSVSSIINGAMVSRVGKDLYFSTEFYTQDNNEILDLVSQEFLTYRTHVINSGGHGDGTYCPVCPGLIISLMDIPTYKDTFPDWEVVYLPNQSWDKIRPFMDLKKKNNGRWWIPGFEYDQDVVDVVTTWLDHWTGYVEETVFDVNMLIIDPKNVLVFNYNKQVFDALDRYGIKAHIVNFRHRYFWDGGIHCVTSDLHRQGQIQDWFPTRS